MLWLRLRSDLRAALALRLVTAVSLVTSFPVPRPRALLGDQHIRALLGAIDMVRDLQPPGAFASFRLAGAGSDSAVFARLAEAIADHTGLAGNPDEADLLIRIRPAVAFPDGWEAVARLTPRPLSARAWRVRNYPGALNAAIAAAVIDLTDPHPGDRSLNVLCGSGTLLIERLLRMQAARAVGWIPVPPLWGRRSRTFVRRGWREGRRSSTPMPRRYPGQLRASTCSAPTCHGASLWARTRVIDPLSRGAGGADPPRRTWGTPGADHPAAAPAGRCACGAGRTVAARRHSPPGPRQHLPAHLPSPTPTRLRSGRERARCFQPCAACLETRRAHTNARPPCSGGRALSGGSAR